MISSDVDCCCLGNREAEVDSGLGESGCQRREPGGKAQARDLADALSGL